MGKENQTKHVGIGYSLTLPILSSQNQNIVFDFVTNFKPNKKALQYLITEEHIYRFDRLNRVMLIALSILHYGFLYRIADILGMTFTYARDVCDINSADILDKMLVYVRDNTDEHAEYLKHQLIKINRLTNTIVKFPVFFTHNDQTTDTIGKHRIDIDLFYVGVDDKELIDHASVISFSKRYLSRSKYVLTKKGVHISGLGSVADALTLQYLGKTVSSVDTTKALVQPGLDGLLTGMKHWFSVFDVYSDIAIMDPDRPSVTFATIFAYTDINRISLKMYTPELASTSLRRTSADLAAHYFSTEDYLRSLLSDYVANAIYDLSSTTSIRSALIQYARQFEMEDFFAVYEQMLITFAESIKPVYSLLEFLARYNRPDFNDYGSLSDVEELEQMQAGLPDTSKFQRPITHWRRTIEPFVSKPIKLKEYNRIIPANTVLYELLGKLINNLDQETQKTVFAYVTSHDVMYYDIGLHMSEYRSNAFKTITVFVNVLYELIDEQCLQISKYVRLVRKRLSKLISKQQRHWKFEKDRLIIDKQEIHYALDFIYDFDVWLDRQLDDDPSVLTGLLLAELMLTYMNFDSLSDQKQA